jgi:hypothetical protein
MMIIKLREGGVNRENTALAASQGHSRGVTVTPGNGILSRSYEGRSLEE